MLAALGLFVQSSFHLPDDVFSNPKGIDALYQVRGVGKGEHVCTSNCLRFRVDGGSTHGSAP